MVRIFVFEITNGWRASDALNPRIETAGHATREAAIEAIKIYYPKGVSLQIEDMVLGIKNGQTEIVKA